MYWEHCYILHVSGVAEPCWLCCSWLVHSSSIFVLLNNKYTLFSASTTHWSVLKSYLDLEFTVPLPLSDTRCEAHATTTSAMAKSCNSVIDAFSHIRTNKSEKGDTRRGYCFLQSKWKHRRFCVTTSEPFIRFKP
jgi:hypothetical protein